MGSTVDRWQFDSRLRKGNFSHTATVVGVTGDELANMRQGRETGRTRRWIPEFAINDAQLRSVIVHTTCSYAFHSKPVPPDIKIDLANLNRLANDRLAFYQAQVDGSDNRYWNSVADHLRGVAEAGGYMALIAAVSYRAWRLRWHDPEIAAQMGLKPHTSRDILNRLVEMANRLGYPTYKPRSDARMRVTPETVAVLWNNGAPVGDIAAILECHATLVRQHLRKLGLFVWGRGKGRKTRGTACSKCGTPYELCVRRDRGGRTQQVCPTCARRRVREFYERAFIKTVAWG